MKKLMIGILVIIPIVVLLVVGLVTSFVSVNAFIGVESVELDKHSLTLELGKTYALDGEGGLFNVTVLPELARDRTYEWTIDNIRSRDAEFPDDENGKEINYVELLDSNGNPVDSVSAGGYIRANIYCNFDLTVQAEIYSDTCSVVVGGDVTDITLLSVDPVKVGEQRMLSPRLTPLDGVLAGAEWHTDDPSVLTVDANGIITGVSRGSAEVWLTANDGELESNHVTVIVNEAASSFGDIISVHTGEFELSRIGVDVSDVVTGEGSGFTLDGGVLRFEDGADRAEVVLDTASGRQTLTIFLCEVDAIEIVQGGALDDYVMEVMGQSLWFTARYASVFRRGETPAVSWSTSNEDIAAADLETGEVRGLMSGDVNVYARTDGGSEASVVLQVRRKVAVLASATTDKSLEAGLARETVFPSMKYADDGTLVPNEYTVNLNYPERLESEDEEVFYDSFTFTAEPAGLVSFDTEEGNGVMNNVMRFDPEAIRAAAPDGEKLKIKITVSAKYPKYEYLTAYSTASFTMTVVDGALVTDHTQLNTTLSEKKIAAVFANNIAVENVSGKDKATDIKVYADVYGNGYIISAQMDQMEGAITPVFNIIADDVTLSNMTIRPNSFSDEDFDNGQVTIDETATFRTGYCVRYNKQDRKNATGDDVTQIKGGRIEFCTLENARSLIEMKGGETVVEGCILRNSSGTAIYISSRGSQYNNLTLTNCVMSNLIGTAFNNDYNSANYKESYEQRSTITQTGFLDIYNWQAEDSIYLLPPDALESIGLGAVKDIVIATLRDVLVSEPNLEGFRREMNGLAYMHLGFISIGLGYPSYAMCGYLPDGRLVEADGRISGTDEYVDRDSDEVSWNTSLEDKRFKSFSSDLISDLSILGDVLKYPVYVWGYDDDTTDLIPGSSYTVNNRLIDRLHGEGA